MATLSVNELSGQHRPRLWHVPAAADLNHADDAIELAAGYGLIADDWQAGVLAGWLGRRRDGKWQCSRCGLAVPRQNGKNGVLEIRELYGMIALGEKFLHTAHEVKTARKAFARLLSFFDNKREFPELAALVKEIRRTNGQEAIVLLNGGSVEFIARSKGSGRGFTVDVLVCDEAQELSRESLAALQPTISAAPLGNPQIIMTGTPPTAGMAGDAFTRMRKSAGVDDTLRPVQAGQLATDMAARLCWHEWSAAGDADLDDERLWGSCNPALGDRLQVETIRDERATQDDVTFGHERCGIWLLELASAGAAIDAKQWKDQADPATQVECLAAFGIAVSFGRATAAIGAAGTRTDGHAHIEVVEYRRGAGWVVERCKELDLAHAGARFVIDGGGPAASLIEPLELAGLIVDVLTTRDVGNATSWMLDGLKDGTIWHGPQTDLDTAVTGAKLRNIGDGMQAFGRLKSSVDIAPLEAVTFAGNAVMNVSMSAVNNVH